MINLACATISTDGFDQTNFKAAFESLPKVGIKFVEFNSWLPDNISESSIKRIKQQCNDTGLVPLSIYSDGFINDDQISRRMMDAALELGCQRIVSDSYPRGEGGGLEKIINKLEAVVAELEKNNLSLCLENHYQCNLEFPEDYLRVFEAIPSRNVGLCMDTGHFHASGVDMIDLIEKMKDKIIHVHLKDNIELGTLKFMNYGDGTIDFDAILNKLIDSGYSGYLVIENSPEIYPIDYMAGETFATYFKIEHLANAKEKFEKYERP